MSEIEKHARPVDPTATMFIERCTQEQPQDDLEQLRPLSVEVVGGPMDGLRSRVTGSELRLGRSQENDLPLPFDLMVSNRHARIVKEGGHYWLEDLGSRNGTFFGDRQLGQRMLITPGATFLMGRTQIEFMPS